MRIFGVILGLILSLVHLAAVAKGTAPPPASIEEVSRVLTAMTNGPLFKMMGVAMLLIGGAIAVVHANPVPAITGIMGATLLNYGPQIMLSIVVDPASQDIRPVPTTDAAVENSQNFALEVDHLRASVTEQFTHYWYTVSSFTEQNMFLVGGSLALIVLFAGLLVYGRTLQGKEVAGAKQLGKKKINLSKSSLRPSKITKV